MFSEGIFGVTTEFVENRVEQNAKAVGFLFNLANVFVKIVYGIFDGIDAFSDLPFCELLGFSGLDG